MEIDRDVSKLLIRLQTQLKKSLSQQPESNTVDVTTPYAPTYAEMAEEEKCRRESSIPTVIDVTDTTVTSQVDRATLSPIFDEIEEEPTAAPKYPRQPPPQPAEQNH